MKKILPIMILSAISINSFSDIMFQSKVPQPDYMSNDWDGDGEINSIDTDDDNDGILDVDDDIPFGGTPGGSVTIPPVVAIPPTNELTFNVAEIGTGADYSASSTYSSDSVCGLFDNHQYNGSLGIVYDVSGTYSGSHCGRGIWLPTDYAGASSGWVQVNNPIQAPIFAMEFIQHASLQGYIFDKVDITYSVNNGADFILHQTVTIDRANYRTDYTQDTYSTGNYMVVLNQPIPETVTNILLNYSAISGTNAIRLAEVRILSSETYRP
jgi:hypothetical protein